MNHSEPQISGIKDETPAKYWVNVGPSVADAGPTLTQHFDNVLCALGALDNINMIKDFCLSVVFIRKGKKSWTGQVVR